jgi:hypothetical protein
MATSVGDARFQINCARNAHCDHARFEVTFKVGIASAPAMAKPPRSHKQYLGRRKSQGQDSDVVLLSVGLGGGGDFFSGLGADGAGAFEAEELTLFVLRLDDAIGEECEFVAGR